MTNIKRDIACPVFSAVKYDAYKTLTATHPAPAIPVTERAKNICVGVGAYASHNAPRAADAKANTAKGLRLPMRSEVTPMGILNETCAIEYDAITKPMTVFDAPNSRALNGRYGT